MMAGVSAHSGNEAVLVLSSTQGEGFGAESVLEELLRGWPTRGRELFVVAPPATRLERVCAETGQHFVALPSRRDALMSNVAAVRRLEPRLPPFRRVHAWSARAFELALLLGRRRGVPVTGTQHDHPAARFIGRVRQQIMRHSANHFDALACVSEATRAACLVGAYKVDMSVIHNGLCDFSVPPRPASPAPVRLGFLGMRSPRKGFALLESWIPGLLAENVELRLYGDVHPDFAECVARLSQVHRKQVLAFGQRPRGQILAEIDILLHLSTEFEPFATVLLEAALAGRACVATDCGGATEAVLDGETGFLFDPAEAGRGLAALSRLCKDADLRERMGKQARCHYETHFRIESMCKAYAELWQIR